MLTVILFLCSVSVCVLPFHFLPFSSIYMFIVPVCDAFWVVSVVGGCAAAGFMVAGWEICRVVLVNVAQVDAWHLLGQVAWWPGTCTIPRQTNTHPRMQAYKHLTTPQLLSLYLISLISLHQAQHTCCAHSPHQQRPQPRAAVAFTATLCTDCNPL